MHHICQLRMYLHFYYRFCSFTMCATSSSSFSFLILYSYSLFHLSMPSFSSNNTLFYSAIFLIASFRPFNSSYNFSLFSMSFLCSKSIMFICIFNLCTVLLSFIYCFILLTADKFIIYCYSTIYFLRFRFVMFSYCYALYCWSLENSLDIFIKNCYRFWIVFLSDNLMG